MFEFEWDPKLDFEPSLSTKKLWLYLRKTPRIIGGVTLPGLFQLPHTSVDTGFFMAALGLEAWGLMNLAIVTEIQFAYMVLPLLIDLVLAFFRHLPQGSICEMSNRLRVEEGVEKEILQSKIKNRQRIAGALSVLIVLAGFGKAYVFWSAQYAAFDALTAGILLSYLLAALIHTQCTGYFLFGLATSVSLWHNRRSYRQGKESGASENQKVTIGARAHSHELEPPFELVEAGARQQRLVQRVRTDNKEVYWFDTWGILRDDELDALAAAQRTSEQSAFVAREGLRHQLYILRAAPRAKSGDEGEEDLDQTRSRKVPKNVVPISAAQQRSLLRFACVVVMVLATGLAACVQSKPARQDLSFPVTILLSQPIAGDQALPEEMLDFLQPIWGKDKECGTLFYPDATLVRIDQSPTIQVHLLKVNPAEVNEAIQASSSKAAKFFKFKPPAEQKVRYVREILANYRPQAVLATSQASMSPGHQEETVTALLKKESGITIFLDPEAGEETADAVAAWKSQVPEGAQVVVAGDGKEAAAHLETYLCSTVAASQGGGSSASRRALIVYRPSQGGGVTEGVLAEESPAEEGDHHEGEKHDEPVIADEGADQLLAALQAKIADQSGRDLKAIEHELIEAELKYSLDYRFPYEHAKLVVFGRVKHPEAFALLYNAGQRAITAGDEDQMLSRLSEDGEEDRPLHKLGHGHAEWKHLLEALQDQDANQLAEVKHAHGH